MSKKRLVREKVIDRVKYQSYMHIMISIHKRSFIQMQKNLYIKKLPHSITFQTNTNKNQIKIIIHI